jgi:hypothetical protein
MEVPYLTTVSVYDYSLMRCLFAVIIYRSAIPKSINFSSQPYPVGLARFADLTFLAAPNVFRKLKLLAYASLLLHAFGVGLAFTSTFLFLFCSAIGSLRNSQGVILHSKQSISIVLLVQAITYIRGAFSQASYSNIIWQSMASEQVAVFWSQQAIIAGYFTAGLSKLIRSKCRWPQNVARLPLQMIKTTEQWHHNELQPVRIDRVEAVAGFLLSHPLLTRTFFSAGLLLEIISPMFLINGTCLLAGGVLLILFHKVTGWFMRLHFYESQLLILIYVINVPFIVINLIRFCATT